MALFFTKNRCVYVNFEKQMSKFMEYMTSCHLYIFQVQIHHFCNQKNYLFSTFYRKQAIKLCPYIFYIPEKNTTQSSHLRGYKN